MPTTILLYARTGAGKTTQIGTLAEDVFKRTKKKTRLCTADHGGLDTVQPYIDLGIIEVVPIANSSIWVWLNRVVHGYTRTDAGAWELNKAKNDAIGLYAFESTHGIAQLMKLDIERKAASGVNIGGDTNTSFEVVDGAEKLKVGTTKGYQKFSIPQTRVYEEVLESFKLPSEYVLWTAGINKDEDEVSSNKITGPDVIGKALTGVLPKDFNYTFKMDVFPPATGKPERHVLYLGHHIDPNAGNATALGNIRRPLDAPPLKDVTVEPADLTRALHLVRHEAQKAATEIIRKRLSL